MGATSTFRKDEVVKTAKPVIMGRELTQEVQAAHVEQPKRTLVGATSIFRKDEDCETGDNGEVKERFQI